MTEKEDDQGAIVLPPDYRRIMIIMENFKYSGKSKKEAGKMILQQNHIFGRLWEQVPGTGSNRWVEKAQKQSGEKAIKFITHGFHKVMILESSQRPGFNIRLFGFPQKPSLIGDDGIINFVRPLETENLDALMNQIDRWVSSFEFLYGEVQDSLENMDSEESLGEEEKEEIFDIGYEEDVINGEYDKQETPPESSEMPPES